MSFKNVNSFVAHGYLNRLFIFTVCFLSLVIIFIWIIDPYGVSPIQVKISGINIYKPKRLDIDRLIKPYEVWRYQPKTIFLGTSRIYQSMNPAVFDGTKFDPAYNAAIPASTLAENAEHIEQFIKLDPHIKHIFIELFHYNFTNLQSQASTPKTWKDFFDDCASLQISNNALVAALQTIIQNKTNGPTPAQIAKRGYRIYNSDFNPGETFSADLFIKTVLSWEHSTKMKLLPDAFKSLDRIVKITQQHGIQLHLIITPNYPWDDYRLLTLGYWPMLEEWLQKMANYDNVMSFSQYNHFTVESPSLSPRMKWWNDPTHFNLNMGRHMLKAYLGHPLAGTPKNFKRVLNSATVEAVIAERHQGVLDWAAAHPDFVANFAKAKTAPEKVV